MRQTYTSFVQSYRCLPVFKMGRKRKNTSFDMRQLVIFHCEKGKSIRAISNMLRIAKSTVGDIIKRYRKEDRILSKPNSGHPKILTKRDRRYVITVIKKDSRISAPQIATMLQEKRGIIVNPETVRSVVRSEGYNGRIARRKPFINSKNRKKGYNLPKNIF
ncbi:uncharacterized protein [Cardiocondyla obscurior]|uniref:uncharacterized protein n=1 Tax=Cardiocondyla obscurior TaxID=286306 RepID=UPI0039658836